MRVKIVYEGEREEREVIDCKTLTVTSERDLMMTVGDGRKIVLIKFFEYDTFLVEEN